MASWKVGIVVDTSVARAANADSKSRDERGLRRAILSYQCLEAIRENERLGVVFDATLLAEWSKHRSEGAAQWFAAMVGGRKVRLLREAVDTAWVKKLIERDLPQRAQRQAAAKDAFLIALAEPRGRRRIVSLDDTARDLFSRLRNGRVRRIHWARPADETVRWLQRGTPDEPALQLGSSSS